MLSGRNGNIGIRLFFNLALLPTNMLWIAKRRHIKRYILNLWKILAVLGIIVFIIIPFIFKYNYKLQQSVVFPNFVNLPKNPNYTDPSGYGLRGVRNFYIETEDNIKLGVWHILPESLSQHYATNSEKYFELALNNGINIIIYNHGNSGTRAAHSRIQLYIILRKYFHVITFDYRSYGDSSYRAPTEEGLVRDCATVYKWIANRASSKIFVWGHSLGTALSTHMISILGTKNIKPAGLILESPFTNMRDEISEYPLTHVFRYLPWFHYTVVEPLQKNDFIFATDRHILNVDCPILILHAEDDRTVPIELGYRLYEETFKYRKPYQGNVKFVGFAKRFGYGHKYIYQAPELGNLIENFTLETVKGVDKKKMYQFIL